MVASETIPFITNAIAAQLDSEVSAEPIGDNDAPSFSRTITV